MEHRHGDVAAPPAGGMARSTNRLWDMQDSNTAARAVAPENFSDALVRLISHSAPSMMAYFELPSLYCRFANPAFAALYGQNPQTLVDTGPGTSPTPLAWQDIAPHAARAHHGEKLRYTREHPAPGADARMLDVHVQPHLDDRAQPLGYFVLLHDISDRWNAERSVHQSNERMRRFTEVTSEAIVFHRDGLVTDGNEALSRLSGYPLTEMLGQPVLSFIGTEWQALVLDYARQQNEDTYEVSIRHKSGQLIPVEVQGRALPHLQGDHRIAVLRDITARKKAQEREAFIALHDTLTQLPNRHFLMQQLTQVVSLARRRHCRAAVMFFNLDHFKTVNDSLGHHAGDQLLCNVADRLRQGVRDSDVVARVGGDEFVVVLSDVKNAEHVALVADKLLASMSDIFTIGELPLTMSPSIGISLFPEDGANADALVRCADAAMHCAKESGRSNRQFYAPSMEAGAMDVLHQELLLREAIATNAFMLQYQPQIRLSDGALLGFEALVRWHHPEHGLVGPDDFISFAESRGLITPIGRWVMREACRQLKEWHGAGLPLVPMAVNMSALEFRQRDVATEVAAVLSETGLAPQHLEIELTESVLIHHSGQVLNTLNALKALGVGISVDDFGTGYSSLAYLKRYPIDKLKIDRSFVADTPQSADDVAIVTAVIQMGRSLQLQTVAEGVETEAQVALLKELGCDQIQGHVVAYPMDADVAMRWLRDFSKESP
jgi:diguanylate cyclase (GGDEF)-like protein/PAS domain S-box-containing protein